MSSGTIALVASAVLLVGAWTYRTAGAEAHARDAKTSRRPVPFEIGDALAMELSPPAALDGSRSSRGTVRWKTDPSETVVGVAAAFLCPEEDARPVFARAENVVAVQRAGELQLAEWLRARQPTQPVRLLYALWIRTEHGLEWRTGAARVDPTELSIHGIAVEPTRRRAVEIRVRSAEGTPIPGALLAIDPADVEPAGLLQYAFTDEAGRVVVSGLPERKAYRASLPAGVGPHGQAVESILAPDAQVVEVVVPMAGAWDFCHIEAVMPFPGASLQLERVEDPCSTTPTAWGVSPWLGPGRGATMPFYLMMPVAGERPKKLRLQFRSFEPIEIDPAAGARVHFVVRADAGDPKSAHTPGTCGPKAMDGGPADPPRFPAR